MIRLLVGWVASSIAIAVAAAIAGARNTRQTPDPPDRVSDAEWAELVGEIWGEQ